MICFLYRHTNDSSVLIFIIFVQVIGAEYGEGFETFRPEGPLKVDVVSFQVQEEIVL